MNRRDLVAVLAERTETDKRSADAALQTFIDVVTETVASGEPVAISGFAVRTAPIVPRMGRNPQTGEASASRRRAAARVTPLKAFKDAVLTGKRPARKTAPAKKTTAKRATAKKAAPAKKTTGKRTAAKKTSRR